MTAGFHASVTILLVVAVVLLGFVTSHLLTKLVKLEARVVEGGRELFGSLRGQKLPAEWVQGAQGLARNRRCGSDRSEGRAAPTAVGTDQSFGAGQYVARAD